MPRSSRWMVQGKSRSCLYLSKTVARGGYLYGLRRVRAFVHLCFRSSFPVQNARREAENICILYQKNRRFARALPSTSMTVNWVKYSKLHRRQELVTAIAYTILVVIMSGYHIYTLVTPAAIL